MMIAKPYSIATADARASAVGLHILSLGGTAIDAAIAIQMVLTLIEPQSSGIGGGSFLLYYDSSTKKTIALNGREVAPKAASPDRFLSMNYYRALTGGLAVGVPGTLSVLDHAHKLYGRLPWTSLFDNAIAMARTGFSISPRLHRFIRDSHHLFLQPSARAYFYDADGAPLPVGHRLINTPLADIFSHLATHGAMGFYHGSLPLDIIHALKTAPVNPALDMSLDDFSTYAPTTLDPLVSSYGGKTILTMPPPSAGGMAMLQILGILAHTPASSFPFPHPMGVHYFTQAAALAYADRNRYMGDPDFVPIPPYSSLLSSAYLQSRANLISPTRSFSKAPAGTFKGFDWGDDSSPEWTSTSHIAIIDSYGNALSMTSTIEHMFGSGLMVHGFMLNNELTDFSLNPLDHGRPVANALAGGKRPFSSMAPVLAFDEHGLFLALGSPGGSLIPTYIAKTLFALLSWGLSLEDAIALPTFSHQNLCETALEESPLAPTLAFHLSALGHRCAQKPLGGNVQAIIRAPSGFRAVSDPRGEGGFSLPS